MLPIYKMIVKEITDLGHQVTSEHVVDPNLTKGDWQSKYNPSDLFLRETNRLDESDMMVADVTSPSWGTAFLIEHALGKNKPVLALFYGDDEQPLPLMIKGHPELYVEHYNEENIHAVLDKNLKHFGKMKTRSGKLVVIDGADGSGKATQTKLLLKYLKERSIPNRYITFPRYKTSFHGKNVGRFLTGEFGGNEEVSPYLSSLAFALDRLTARDQIVEWLDEGAVVVADRYVSASLAHQGAKLEGRKQHQFLEWLYSMEYKEHKLPKEDVVIFLHVPVETAQKLLEKSGGKGDVAGKDIAEKDLNHQKRSVEMYKAMVKKNKHWVMIDCVDDQGQLFSINEIHQKILAVLTKKKII